MDEALLKQAEEARSQGQLALAISLCEGFLGRHPDHPRAESFLGLCQIETGNAQGALLIEKAARTEPVGARAMLNLSILREMQGDLRSAVSAANKSVELAPERFEGWGQLGKLLGLAGKYRDAATALERALAIKPSHGGVAMLLAGAAVECENLPLAERAIKIVDQSSASVTPDILKLRTHFFSKKRNWRAATAAAREWLAADSSNDDARAALAFSLSQEGYYKRAADTISPLAAAGKTEHIAAMARYRLGDRQIIEAEKLFKRVLSINSNHADAACGMARCSLYNGSLEDAEEWARRAICADPKNADAFGLLIEATGGRVSDDDLSALRLVAENAAQSSSSRTTLYFAEGDVLHRRKEYEGAFAAWSRANTIKRAAGVEVGQHYDAPAQKAITGRLQALFGAQTPIAPGYDGATRKTPIPIFIVGMPRSGTTLLESALSAHKDINAAGEVAAMPYILQEFLDWAQETGWQGGDLPDEKKSAWRKFYLENGARFGAGRAAYFTDKQPENFRAAGLIRMLFPESPIIHIRRNPVETGFSIFRRNFSAHWSFATNLTDIGHFYAEHSTISAHWNKHLGNAFGFVQYEKLVAQFETELRRLLEFCGLPWDEACLRYFENDRSVFTFSASQVRKAPSVEHLNPSAPYAEMLGQLRDALGAGDVDLQTGARV